MNRKSLVLGIAVCLLPTPAAAQDPFACKDLDGAELRVFQSLGSIVNKAPPPKAKAKKGVIVVDEERSLVTDWFKPEGSIGSIIPYKQPQLTFSRYLMGGKKISALRSVIKMFLDTESRTSNTY
jgi:hypothetical protein